MRQAPWRSYVARHSSFPYRPTISPISLEGKRFIAGQQGTRDIPSLTGEQAALSMMVREGANEGAPGIGWGELLVRSRNRSGRRALSAP